MIIREMTATFGRLEQERLEPGPGLTVITAPNEGGKSTWAAFLRAMLYGINTREKDKTGYIAEKNRYAPWSGAPMEGELKLSWQGEEITLRRFARRGAPFGGFEAVCTGSGQPAPGLTGETAGAVLIGAGREMYERSGFLGQGNAAVTAADELERRIAALATSGEEGVSFSQARRQLKDWANRRRVNRATGLIPELEEELADVEDKLERLSGARRREAAALEERARLRAALVPLERELEFHQALEQRELDKKYVQACQELKRAEAQIPALGRDPVFGELSAQAAWEQAEDDAAVLEELRRPEPLAGLGPVCAFLAALAAVLLGAGAFFALPWLAASAALPALGLVGFAAWKLMERSRRRAAREAQAVRLLKRYRARVPGDLLARAAEYRERLAEARRAQDVADSARALVDALAAQGAREYTGPNVHTRPGRSREETAASLRRTRQELEQAERTLAQAQGALSSLGDPDELEARRDLLLEEQAARTEELEALNEAIEALEQAEETLRRRFSPALNKRAGELFSRLTGGAYRTLTLTRSFEASAQESGGLLPRSGLLLSQGTADQLYLAVRLAVCELTLSQPEPAPLVLDDALANFDGARMASALELLAELGKERQILLFSCHEREAEWAQAHGMPLIRL